MPTLPRDEAGSLIIYSWPGGYPVYYITADGGTLCPACARDAELQGLTNDPHDPQWHIVAVDVNYEDALLLCDDCYEPIECAYPPDEEGNDDNANQ